MKLTKRVLTESSRFIINKRDKLAMDQKLGLMPIALLILVLAVLGVGGATLFYPKKRVFAPPQIFQEQQEKTNTYQTNLKIILPRQRLLRLQPQNHLKISQA